MRDRRGSAARLSVDVVNGDGADVVVVAGEIDVATTLPLARTLQDVARGPGRAIVVDLSSVRFMDSTGISHLLSLKRQLDRQGRGLAVRCGPGAVHTALAVLGLLETLNVALSVAS